MDNYDYNLPGFEPVKEEELRQIWAKNSDPDIRRMALEVARYRRLVADVGRCHEAINRAWREMDQGHLTVLIHLKRLLDHERLRLPPDN